MDYGLWIDFVLVKIIKLLISVDCENMILFHAVSNLFKIILPCLSDIDFDNNSVFSVAIATLGNSNVRPFVRLLTSCLNSSISPL